MIILRTERLILRHWRAEDLPPFAAINADPLVMECFPACLTHRESDDLALRITEAIAQRGWGLYAVEWNGAFIGFTGLSVPAFLPSVEIGWRLAPAAWGQGIATEAARAVAQHAFQVLEIPALVSFTSTGNARSRRVMGKLGMTHDPEDDFDHPAIPQGHPLRRHVLYRLRA